MVKFYGSVKGSGRTLGTRSGTANSGLETQALTSHTLLKVALYTVGEKTFARVTIDEGDGAYCILNKEIK